MLEETGIVAVPERLAMVHVTDPVVYDNGDQTQYLDLVFRFAWQSGVPCPADGENTAADWFPLDDLPPMSDMYRRIAVAVSDEPAAQYVFSPQSTGDVCGARHPGDRSGQPDESMRGSPLSPLRGGRRAISAVRGSLIGAGQEAGIAQVRAGQQRRRERTICVAAGPVRTGTRICGSTHRRSPLACPSGW
ncbi:MULTISPECIES: hypothetical protein [Streptomyces]|uniref:hypothetical protein n=1 Tax=Streptomyces TaxID=1883 RepID=UPI0029B425DA|nr:hypothetical protein [Streptomyces sp. NRRL_B-2557]MDX2748343.1 hypothetical protein [Streptomyces sp. NRRL_B-2557]